MLKIESQQSTINNQQSNWFASWFDTPYYHILYKDRNYREAQVFMDNLTRYLNLPDHAKVLDLACGKGRHSIYLNQLGFKVLGADLSENSIEIASKNANDTLQFKVHDMREPFEEKFDAVFNLFTSFGYFDTTQDNLKTLVAIKESLSDCGFAVIDFMNVSFVVDNLIPEETKTIEEIDFHLKRYVKDGFIIKEIDFEDQGLKYHYEEKVRALTLQDFKQMMEESGIYLLDTFGDYKLKKYHKNTSERLIMIFK
jgi:SAM-dependent methyltransferase